MIPDEKKSKFVVVGGPAHYNDVIMGAMAKGLQLYM